MTNETTLGTLVGIVYAAAVLIIVDILVNGLYGSNL